TFTVDYPGAPAARLNTWGMCLIALFSCEDTKSGCLPACESAPYRARCALTGRQGSVCLQSFSGRQAADVIVEQEGFQVTGFDPAAGILVDDDMRDIVLVIDCPSAIVED